MMRNRTLWKTVTIARCSFKSWLAKISCHYDGVLLGNAWCCAVTNYYFFGK